MILSFINHLSCYSFFTCSFWVTPLCFGNYQSGLIRKGLSLDPHVAYKLNYFVTPRFLNIFVYVYILPRRYDLGFTLNFN